MSGTETTSRAGVMETEPAITITTITTAISAVIAVLALWWPEVQEYEGTILGFVAAVWPLATAFWIRFRVFAPATVAGIEQDLRDSGL